MGVEAKRSSFLRYGTAVMAVTLTLLLKMLLDPFIIQEIPFWLVFAPVIISAWCDGLGPGLLAAALAGLAADYFFLTSENSFSDLSLEAVPRNPYILEGLLINRIVVALRYAKPRAEASAPEGGQHILFHLRYQGDRQL